jgi:MFS transporter, SHS family, sialic acid transporter
MTAEPSARARWMTLTAALLGWMFDGLEMGLFPLVARPALGDLLGTNDREVIGKWFAVITAGFLVGAATGGVLFGWLGDRIGRVRAMTLSVFTYAIFSGLCGLATSPEQIAGLRFVAALGMGGEWSLGVALVMEVWPDRSRAWLAGVIGAAANFGYMIIAVVALGLGVIIQDLQQFLPKLGFDQATSDWLVKNSGWRILMLCGAVPALLTFLIRLFVPESQKWHAEKAKGTTGNWATRDLVGVLIGALAACGIIALWAIPDCPTAVRIAGSLVGFVVCLLGYLYPILRFVRRAQGDRPAENRKILNRLLLAAALSGVALLGTWGSTQWAPVYADELIDTQIKTAKADGTDPAAIEAMVATKADAKAYTQMASASGAVIGCIVAAFCGDWLGRRKTYAMLCLLSIAATVNLYLVNVDYNTPFLFSAFLAGTITAAFYGWLPLYLPELFPTKIRATGQGFGFNFGRVLAAIGVLQLPNIMRQLEVGYPVACTAMSAVYLVGFAIIWLAPETKGQPLPE